MKASAEPQEMMVAIVADDLTGACDAGVHFGARGMQTSVMISPDAEAAGDTQVIVCNTDTRCSDVSSLGERLVPALELARDRNPQLLMKKLDTILRGPVGQEIALMLERLQLPLAIVAPAFPGTGRVVREGRVLLPGGSLAVHIAACLSNMRCAHVSREEIGVLGDRIVEEIRRGTKALIVDAEDNEDLLRLARQEGKVPRVLWAGSGGLARAFATVLAGDLHTIQPHSHDGPVLICVGSDHSVTTAQMQRIKQETESLHLRAEEAGYALAKAALSRGQDVVLEFSRKRIEADPDTGFGDKIGVQHCGSVIATGGDTALYVLRSLGAHSIRLRAEIEPGIPWGQIVGGAADGKTVVTKSGGFGDSGSLLACIDFLNPSAVRGQKEKTW